MLEMIGVVMVQLDWGDSQGCVGQFFDYIDWKIVDDGELLVKGDVVFKGYYGNLVVMVEMIVDGWFYIGDVVEIVFDGLILIVDCKKDIIINVVGKNLLLFYIENMMKVLLFIKECIVIGDKCFYVIVFIQIDFEIVCVWVEVQGIIYIIFWFLVEIDEVVNLINVEVEC